MLEAAGPILEWLRIIFNHPGNPVCLLGTSNGSRISAYIEKELRSIQSIIKVSSVAGAHYGSHVLANLNKRGVSQVIFSEEVREELTYGSAMSKLLLKEPRKPLPEGVKRDFEILC